MSMQAQVCNLVVKPNPFEPYKEISQVQANRPVCSIIDDLGYPEKWKDCVVVEIDGKRVYAEFWDRVDVKTDQNMMVRMVPRGGEGGKSILRMVAFIAVAVVAVLTGNYVAAKVAAKLAIEVTSATAIAAGVVAASAVGIAGAMLINALLPLPTVKAKEPRGQDAVTPTITGIANRYNHYGVVPKVFGKRRLYPPFAAVSYSEFAGNNQYFTAIVGVVGPCKMSDIRLGETAIDEFEDVQVEVREGFDNDSPRTLYTTDVNEQGLQIKLDTNWQTRTSIARVRSLEVDVVAPLGMLYVDPQGDSFPWEVPVNVQYAKEGTDDWRAAGDILVDGKTTSALWVSLRWEVFDTSYEGKWDVRVRRQRVETSEEVKTEGKIIISERVVWATLRERRDDDPIKEKNLATVTVRIKATDQLSGNIDSLNMLCHAYEDVWDGTLPTLTKKFYRVSPINSEGTGKPSNVAIVEI